MTSTERVMAAIEFRTPDRLPRWDNFDIFGVFAPKWRARKNVCQGVSPADYYGIDIGMCMPEGINVEHMYGEDLSALKKQTEYVLDSTAGFKHMIGDTNASYPAYPWENIKTVIDVVRQRGRLFE